jgi:hypothetical protein
VKGGSYLSPDMVEGFLRPRGFAVSRYHGYILARLKNKSVVITANPAEGRRGNNWSDVRIRLCREWEEYEVASMLEGLWRAIEQARGASPIVEPRKGRRVRRTNEVRWNT